MEAYVVIAELSEFDQIEKMLADIDEKGTQIDIVLNNAGVQVAYREEYLKTPMSDYETSFKINTSSGIQLDPQQTGYSASKAALDKVTVDLGSKYEGTDVILSLADPGWCRTDLGGEKAPNEVTL